MNQEDIKEAKLVMIAAAKIRDFCNKQERCEECPLFVPEGTETCYMMTRTPERYDPEEILYIIGYKAGKGES